MEETLTVRVDGEKVATPVSQVSHDDLLWYANDCKSARLKGIAQAELARRGGKPGAAPSPAAPTTLARAADVQITTGAFRDPQRATDALRQAAARGHLVAPAPICGSIPEGCSMALAAVLVDPATETYKISGKLGLSKVALDKIAAAAGVSWDVRECRRLDDGSDPHYCHYRAAGRVRDFDGTVRVVSGEVEMDAREGSPLIEEIKVKAARGKDGPRDPASQILELRKFLLRHAESKAKNRAIRSLGVRTSYEPRELEKPFVVAKVMFTGETNDPELKRLFAEKTADAFLGGQRALYGEPMTTPALPAADGAHAPPPVGSVAPSEADIDAEGEDLPPATPAVTTPPTAMPPSAKLEGLPVDQDRGANPDRY